MCMSDMAAARKMKSSTLWFCFQENKQVLTGILPSDENCENSRSRLVSRIIGNLKIHFSCNRVYQDLRKLYREKCITIHAKETGHCHASDSGHDYAGSCCDVLGARANYRGTRLLRYLGSQRRKEHAPEGQHNQIPNNRH